MTHTITSSLLLKELRSTQAALLAPPLTATVTLDANSGARINSGDLFGLEVSFAGSLVIGNGSCDPATLPSSGTMTGSVVVTDTWTVLVVNLAA